jgi:hypothetical protein
MKKFVLCLVIVTLAFTVIPNSVFPQAERPESENVSKIYPLPNQILITPTAIFVHSNRSDELIKVERLEIEEGKICAVVRNDFGHVLNRGPCGLHKVWHKACGGCGVLLCPMNCTCFD